jgi:hypothetical protein
MVICPSVRGGLEPLPGHTLSTTQLSFREPSYDWLVRIFRRDPYLPCPGEAHRDSVRPFAGRLRLLAKRFSPSRIRTPVMSDITSIRRWTQAARALSVP